MIKKNCFELIINHLIGICDEKMQIKTNSVGKHRLPVSTVDLYPGSSMQWPERSVGRSSQLFCAHSTLNRDVTTFWDNEYSWLEWIFIIFCVKSHFRFIYWIQRTRFVILIQFNRLFFSFFLVLFNIFSLLRPIYSHRIKILSNCIFFTIFLAVFWKSGR